MVGLVSLAIVAEIPVGWKLILLVKPLKLIFSASIFNSPAEFLPKELLLIFPPSITSKIFVLILIIPDPSPSIPSLDVDVSIVERLTIVDPGLKSLFLDPSTLM